MNDSLERDDNKRVYDKREAENRRIVMGLEKLLAGDSVFDKPALVRGLREIDARLVGSDIEEYKSEEILEGVRDVLAKMKGMFSEYLGPSEKLSLVDTAVDGAVVPDTAQLVTAQAADGAPAQPPDAGAVESSDGSGIERELRTLSERSMSVNDVIEALEKLGVIIPDDELVRMRSLLPTELTPETRAKILKLRGATEDEAAPLIVPLPKKVIYQGEEKPFSIELLQTIISKAKEAGLITKALYLSNYVTNDTKTQTWGSTLRAWTSKCLKGSKDKPYRGNGGQLELQRRVLGDGCEIHADMILAMALYLIKTGKEIMPFREDGFMRLNDVDRVGYPLRVSAGGGGRVLGRSGGGAHPDGGLGGSLRISS